MTTRNPNLNRLLEEWRHLYKRYGMKRLPPELEQLQLSLRRRKTSMEHIRAEITELEARLETLETESDGVDKTMELVLSEAIASLLDNHVEAWSPVPVLGFRIWDVGPAGFHGYRQKWTTSQMKAECLTIGIEDEVPHTDGSCGDPPCGVYAVKSIAPLILGIEGHMSERLAAGLVGMKGKVVEHELGYRAAEAEVVALGIQQPYEPFLTADRWQIESLFENKGTVSLLLNPSGHPPEFGYGEQNSQIIEFLEDEERRRSPWI